MDVVGVAKDKAMNKDNYLGSSPDVCDDMPLDGALGYMDTHLVRIEVESQNSMLERKLDEFLYLHVSQKIEVSELHLVDVLEPYDHVTDHLFLFVDFQIAFVCHTLLLINFCHFGVICSVLFLACHVVWYNLSPDVKAVGLEFEWSLWF